MKGPRPWNAMDPLSSLSSEDDEDSSSSGSDNDDRAKENEQNKKASSQSAQGGKTSARKNEADGRKPTIDYEALSRHGYYGGPSVLKVPPPRPKEPGEQDWSWSAGKRKGDSDNKQEEESYEERERTRRAVSEGATLSAAQGIAERNFMKKQRKELAKLSLSHRKRRGKGTLDRPAEGKTM